MIVWLLRQEVCEIRVRVRVKVKVKVRPTWHPRCHLSSALAVRVSAKRRDGTLAFLHTL